MSVDYNDERFAQVETDKKAALAEVENTYKGMINDSDSYYQAQIDASKDWADKQTQLQQEKTDFAIEQIEQQKDQAQKDYTREQSGAYVDWQKQSDQHGVRAEQIADMGMQNTGYSESSQVSMYITYQNRVASARESFNKAILNYDNSIKEARLQNNSVLAEIAHNALQQQLELSLQGFQYKNQLLLDLADKKTQTETLYYQRYQDVLSQINTENALAEQIRQFNEQMALEREQFEWQKAMSSGGGSGGGGGGGGDLGGGVSRISKDDGSNIDKDTTSGDGPSIDLDSVLKLGMGPLSGSQIAALEAQGKIKVTQKGNKLYVKDAIPTKSSSSKTSSSKKGATGNDVKNAIRNGNTRALGGLLYQKKIGRAVTSPRDDMLKNSGK